MISYMFICDKIYIGKLNMLVNIEIVCEEMCVKV